MGRVIELRRRGCAIWAGLIAAGMSLAAAPSLAQNPNPDDEAVRGTVNMLKPQTPLAAWGLAAFFLIACLAIAFKNSKRGHLD